MAGREKFKMGLPFTKNFETLRCVIATLSSVEKTSSISVRVGRQWCMPKMLE